MKIVINDCYGGFGISPTALKLAIARGAPGVESYPVTKGKLKDAGDGYKSNWLGQLVKNDMVYYYSDASIYRNDPILISIIEELGEEANGEFAKLRIVEIPDVLWDIVEYDGLEHIAERHRTWR